MRYLWLHALPRTLCALLVTVLAVWEAPSEARAQAKLLEGDEKKALYQDIVLATRLRSEGHYSNALTVQNPLSPRDAPGLVPSPCAGKCAAF